MPIIIALHRLCVMDSPDSFLSATPADPLVASMPVKPPYLLFVNEILNWLMMVTFVGSGYFDYTCEQTLSSCRNIIIFTLTTNNEHSENDDLFPLRKFLEPDIQGR